MEQKGKQTDIDDRPESMLPPFNIPAYSEEGFTSIIAPSPPLAPLIPPDMTYKNQKSQKATFKKTH